jgi:ubiquitin C-terminal hydrolase
MNYGTSACLYSTRSDHLQQPTSLSIVPRLSATQKCVSLRVCQGFRNRNDIKFIYIFEDDTLEKVKEEICKQLCLTTKPTDFSLTTFNEVKRIWMPIDDANTHKTIADLNLPEYTILNIELHEDININQQPTPTIKDTDLTLKLCKRPMNKTDFHYLDTHSSITIGQLKEEARKRVINQKTNYLYFWTNDGWAKLEAGIDDLTLAEMHFDRYSVISFETEDDFIPGVCGLTNLGNTCFMNSALQCLSNIPELTRKVLSFGNEMNAPIIGAYSTLIKTMWSGEHIVTTPSSLLLNIRENLPRYSRSRQQDAQEFMNYFLHLIHQELTSEKTLITDLFHGQIRSSVKCLGECRSIETNEETISFLPLPIENDIDQYQLLYLRSNGEHRLVTVRTRARTIDTLITSFIEQHEPTLSFNRIQAVRIVNNRIRDTYSSYLSLTDAIKHQLTFIEIPEKTYKPKYVEFVFLDQETSKPFRPSVFLVCPYGCRYSDISDQIDQIKDHLCAVTNAPSSAYHLFWINMDNESRQLNTEKNSNDSLLLIDRVTIKMDPEWIEKYTKQSNFDHPPDKASLNSLLEDFFHEEPLNGDYYCSKCLRLTEARQKADLALPLPRILIIQLKRFSYDTYSDAKIDTHIDFPLSDLNLSHYVTQTNDKDMDESAMYDLVAVSNHTGSLVSGHYTTYARNVGNKRWYSFNDEIFREIDKKDIVTKNAYILVYVKQTAS